MSQQEIITILDHPMTAREISLGSRRPLQGTKDNLQRMLRNGVVEVARTIGCEHVYQRAT